MLVTLLYDLVTHTLSKSGTRTRGAERPEVLVNQIEESLKDLLAFVIWTTSQSSKIKLQINSLFNSHPGAQGGRMCVCLYQSCLEGVIVVFREFFCLPRVLELEMALESKHERKQKRDLERDLEMGVKKGIQQGSK